MEMKKLHMGTMSYGSDSMDEVAHQLAVSFGASGDHGAKECFILDLETNTGCSSTQTRLSLFIYRGTTSNARTEGYVLAFT